MINLEQKGGKGGLLHFSLDVFGEEDDARELATTLVGLHKRQHCAVSNKGKQKLSQGHTLNHVAEIQTGYGCVCRTHHCESGLLVCSSRIRV